MENTENNSSTLNPAIIKQAQKLFALIEAEVEQSHEDTVIDLLTDEMEAGLNDSRAAQLLVWSFLWARKRSEEATNTLEESCWYMRDETLETIHELAKNANEATNYLREDEINVAALERRIKELEKLAPLVLQNTRSEFRYRCIRYGTEIRNQS